MFVKRLVGNWLTAISAFLITSNFRSGVTRARRTLADLLLAHKIIHGNHHGLPRHFIEVEHRRSLVDVVAGTTCTVAKT
jgi:hypothetical protein